MREMISVSAGFQSSVNIAFDLYDDKKLQSFIPTNSALMLLKEVLLSVRPDATERARILIGPYGKGKSHIVLMILSILMQKDLSLFLKLMPTVSKLDPELKQLIEQYYQNNKKMLPVVITGSSTSLSQSFLLALKRTLEEHELLDVIPTTNYSSALNVLHRWEESYPETYQSFCDKIDMPISAFMDDLSSYDNKAYETFERIYPELTAGSQFSAFQGADVIEIYEEAIEGLSKHGFSGIYVIYDEFSKYLENNISETTKQDTKILQDMAEKCSRSGEKQFHLMLISHKEITSYIDKVSKQMVDGWRGVSERFIHVYLNNNFNQTYEIIAAAIEKDPKKWKEFKQNQSDSFQATDALYHTHPIFNDMDANELKRVEFGCYPLHPVTTFVLPRLSERVAQNERTLFTFLSSSGENTLRSFLDRNDLSKYCLVTPDILYDYFEPLLKQELYSGSLHKYYLLTTDILRKLESGSLEAKIVKIISLIYILEQFELLKPTRDELLKIFSGSYVTEDINAAIESLIEQKYVVYLKRSNGYLNLKESSGVDIRQEISDVIQRDKGKVSAKEILNTENFDKYLYPSRYNDDYAMTRYFSFEFIDSKEIRKDVNWTIKSEQVKADGIVYGVIAHSKEEIEEIDSIISETTQNEKRIVFVVPQRISEILDVIEEFNAVSKLKNAAESDSVLFEEYEVIYEDLKEVINDYISDFTHPEKFRSSYYYLGKKERIYRKADLTKLMSDICDSIFYDTPVINNEVINLNELTTATTHSRNKVLSGLLRNELERNLGLTGTGQEVSIMRSTLINTKILIQNDIETKLDFSPKDERISNMLQTIVSFVVGAKNDEKACFADLYRKLMAPDYHIGIRKGLIPIYLSAVLHEYKADVVISNDIGQLPINVDAILQIDSDPEEFYLSYVKWDEQKEATVLELEKLFSDYVSQSEKSVNAYEYVFNAMKRWFRALPKYTKEMHQTPSGEIIPNTYRSFLRELKKESDSYKFLFEELPNLFGADYVSGISDAEDYYNSKLDELTEHLIQLTKECFGDSTAPRFTEMSLASVVKDWLTTLDPAIHNQLFLNGTEKCISIFSTASYDDSQMVTELARIATDLRIEDWNDSMPKLFEETLELYKTTAEQFRLKGIGSADENVDADTYQISYQAEDGTNVIRRFEKVERSSRGKLLYNSIKSQLSSMGQSVSEQEKRQVLLDVLNEIC